MKTVNQFKMNISSQGFDTYTTIEKAITYLKENFVDQPSLDEVAKKVHMSPHHFQKTFKSWAGVSPKKFLQYLTLEHAKEMLDQNSDVYSTAYQSGLSGTGRLHDLFVNVEAMTPGEYKKGGEQLEISANNYESPFGSLVIGSTNKGICHVAFTSQDAKIEIANQFPKAQIIKASPDIHNDVLEFIYGIHTKGSLKLHIKGTAFQLKVWEALLNIPFGQLASYGHISQRINHPRANRAVGSAIGKNPIAYLIPCHRVIKSDGTTGGYRWGNERKQCILGWEAAKTEKFQTA